MMSRPIARTGIGLITISTVELPNNEYAYGTNRYETIIFGEQDEELYSRRCETAHEAFDQHVEAINYYLEELR
jgi:hypothetical protein